MTDQDFVKALPVAMFVIILLIAVVVGVGFGLLQFIHWIVS